MDERPDSSQQLMDILLVMDEKGTLQAVSGVKDGELQTKNPLEDNNDLLRVDRHGDMFSNFFSNLWNQLKDPTRFHFFRHTEEMEAGRVFQLVPEVGKEIRKHMAVAIHPQEVVVVLQGILGL